MLFSPSVYTFFVQYIFTMKENICSLFKMKWFLTDAIIYRVGIGTVTYMVTVPGLTVGHAYSSFEYLPYMETIYHIIDPNIFPPF